MRSNIGVLAALSAAAFGLRAFPMGADHPADRPVNLSEAPAGLNALINWTNRVHGYFVNAEDRFFFAGDSESFSAFLKQYAALDGIAGRRLTVREGKGQARSPWDKGDGKACDWVMDVALVSWVEGHRDVFRDATGGGPGKEKPKYLAEVEVWNGGAVDLKRVCIPPVIHVARPGQREAPATSTNAAPSGAMRGETTSPLRQVKLAVGMKRLEAERVIAEATGVKSGYDLHAMDTSREVRYRDGSTVLVVRYKPGSPAPWIATPDGGAQHLPPVDGEVLSWEFRQEAPTSNPE